MTLEVRQYFGLLRAYVNDDYVIHEGTDGKVILKGIYYRPEYVIPRNVRFDFCCRVWV